MLDYLEKLLKDKTVQIGKKWELLYAQWQIDKEYATKILSTIFNIFPHYTLHDRSHSEEILNNIGKILKKETFESFSLTDLLLLLYAAFYHDIGMAVFAYELDEILKDEKFFYYLEEIMRADSKHNLHKEANEYFKISDKKITWKKDDISLEKIEAFKFILAEYIRRRHSERTENTLKNDPSVNIPGRLKCILGKICECHTESFEKVMELPFEEAGLEYEPCHPRFIACLLRLGDLLDLDNNRVSEIVLRTIKTIPAESFFHIQKHLSISHININSKQIDITAECEEYKTADLASSWFSWLDKEITDQMKNWNQIVPNPEFGFLPTVGNLKVELSGYDSIDGKVHPKFEIDTQKAIEILQGANLYEEKFQSIREILQNSVDATYLRIWVENKDSNSNMTLDEFIKECGKDEYAIRVKIEKNEDSSDDEKIVWKITIADAGIGMSKEDLKFLYKTGSSSNNKEKQKYLSEMPEYMKPSGTFGIGFQSIFLITDKVQIRTRKYNSGDEYDIDLYDPTGEDNGTILLKTIKNSDFKVGTEVSFDLVDPVSDYDFIEPESLDLVNDKLVNAIEEFAEASYQQIKLKIDNVEQLVNKERMEFPYHLKETNLAVYIPAEDFEYDNSYSVFYRNQPVKESSLDFRFFKINVNILGGDAKDVLTLNRNEINSKYYDKLYRDTIVTVLEYLKKNFTAMSDKDKFNASAFVYLYADTAGIELDNSEIFTKWEKYPVDIVENETITQVEIGCLIQKIDSVKIVKSLLYRRGEEFKKYMLLYRQYRNRNIYTHDIYVLEKDFLLVYSRRRDRTFALLCKAMSPYFCVSNYDYDNRTIILHRTTENSPRTNKQLWESWLDLTNNLTNTRVVPCNPEYIKLAIDNYKISYSLFYNTILEYFPKMISPYIVERSTKLLKKDMTEKLIDFVFRNRKDVSVTKDEIRKTYEKFIKDSEFAINEINSERTI